MPGNGYGGFSIGNTASDCFSTTFRFSLTCEDWKMRRGHT